MSNMTLSADGALIQPALPQVPTQTSAGRANPPINTCQAARLVSTASEPGLLSGNLEAL